MDDQNKSTNAALANSGSTQTGAPFTASDSGGQESPSGSQALSLDQPASGDSKANAIVSAPSQKQPNTFVRAAKRADIILAILLVLGSAGLLLSALVNRGEQDNAVGGDNVAGRFDSIQIPLDDIGVGEGLEFASQSVTINGALQVNGDVVLTPSVQPSSPTTGQIYYDQTSNVLAYYDGTQFINLTAGVESIGGNTGAVTLSGANGITVTDDGEGNITFTGPDLPSAGVTSLNGLDGAISINNSSAAGGAITIDDASASSKGIAQFNSTNFTISGGNVNTVQDIGSSATPTFAGVNTNTITPSGGTVTIGGDLNVSGTTTLSSPLGVASGGTGATSLTANGVLVGQGTSPVIDVAGSEGECLLIVNNTPDFTTCPGGGGSGVTTVGTIDAEPKSADGAVINGTIIHFQTADTSFPGMVSTGAQTFAGDKTFNGTVAVGTLGTANSDDVICRNSATNQLAGCNSTFATTDDLDGYVQLQGATPGTAQTGNINVSGTVIAGTFSGSGADLTNLNASNIATGTLNDARLSPNVALLNAPANFTAALQQGGNDVCTTAGNCAGLGFGVDSLNSLTGALTLQGTGGQIVVNDNGADTITFSLGSSVTLQGNTFNGANELVQLNASSQLPAVSGALLTNLNASALTAGTVANARLANGGQLTVTAGSNLTGGGPVALGGTVTLNVADSPTFAGDVVVEGGNLTLGTAGPAGADGALILQNATNAFSVSLNASNQTVGSATASLPDTAGVDDTVCLQSLGNCVGTGGGIQGSGTPNRLAVFTAGNTIGDSSIIDDGSTVTVNGDVDFAVQGSNVTIGAGGTRTGAITLHNSTNTNAVAIQSGATGTSYTLTLPTAAGAANQCLKAQDGTGTLFWDNCLGGGGGSGVSSLNGQTGAVTINNATGAGGAITIDDAAADGTTKGIATFNATNFTDNGNGVINTVQNIDQTAAPTFGGLTLNGALNMGANDITGTNFSVQGSSGNTSIGGTLGVSSSVTVGSTAVPGSLMLHDGQGGGFTGTLESAALGGNRTYILPDFTGTSAEVCLATGNCAGLGQVVDSLNGLQGDLSLAGTAGQITVTTGADTITFSLNSGVTLQGNTFNGPNQLVQLNASGQLPAISGALLTDLNASALTTGTVANARLVNGGQLTVNAGSNLTGGGAVALGGNITIDVADSPTFAGNVTVQGGGVTVGADSVQGVVTLHDGGTGASAFTGALQTGTLSANHTYVLPDLGGTPTTDTVCMQDLGNCFGSGGGVTSPGGTAGRLAVFSGGQTVEDSWLLQNSSTLTLDATRDLSLAGGNLSVTGMGSFTGSVTAVGVDAGSGLLQGTGGLNVSGGATVAGTTSITGSTNINTSGTANTAIGNATGTFALQGNASSTLTATDSGFTTTVGFIAPTADVTLNFPALGTGTYEICTSQGNCAGAGVSLQNAYNNSNPAIVNLNATNNGILIRDTAGGIGGNLFAVQNSDGSDDYLRVTTTGIFSQGDAELQGGDVHIGSSSQIGSLVLRDGTGQITVLQPGDSAGNLTFVLPTDGGGQFQCLKKGTVNQLIWDDCEGGGSGTSGVTSLNSLTGNLVVQGTTNQVTVNDNGVDTLTLSLPQDIHTGATPTFAGMTLNGALGMSTNPITNAGLINGQTISGSANFTGTMTVASDITSGGDSQAGSLTLYDGGAGASAFTGVLQVATLGQGTTFTLPDPGAASATICLSTGNCGQGGDVLQGGNSFGTAMTIGTNDAFDLNLETSGATRLTVAADGSSVTLANDTDLLLQGTTAYISNPQSASGANSESFGLNATITEDDQVVIGNGATGAADRSTVIGRLGNSGAASCIDAVLLGYNTTCSNNNGVAIGSGAGSSGGVAIGQAAGAGTSDAVAIGRNASGSSGGVAVGGSADASSDAIAIGGNANATTGGTAIGDSANVSGVNGIALGINANVGTNANDSIVIGEGATASGAAESNHLVIGSNDMSIQQGFIGNGITNATPSDFTLNATGGSGTDIAGAALNIAGGRGTGAAAGGDVNIQVSAAGGSGATLNPLSTVATFSSSALTLTSGVDLVVQGGSSTIGTTTQQGGLILHDGDGQTVTISVGSALAASTDLAIPAGVGASDTFCLQTLANCGGGGSGDINQGGNSFGTAMTIGTNDAFDLNLETNGVTVGTFSGTDGSFTLQAAADSASNFEVLSNSGTSLFSVAASTGEVLVTNDGNDAVLHVQATTGNVSPYVRFDTGNSDDWSIGLHDDGLNGDFKVAQNNGFGSNVYLTVAASNGNLTAASDMIVQGGMATLGTTAQQGSLVMHDGDGQTATISVGSALAANTALAIPTGVGASDTFCLQTLANCGGGNNAFVQGGNAFSETAVLGTTDNEDLQFATNNTGRMTISAAGDVGVGTATPERRLDVAVNDATTNAPPFRILQNGTGDTSMEFSDSNKSFFAGMDGSDGGAFKIASSASSGVPENVGYDNENAICCSTSASNEIWATEVTTTNGGSVSSISIYVESVDAGLPGGTVALYSDDAANNRPGNLIATGTKATLDEGWNAIPVSATVAASTSYWLGVNLEGNTDRFWISGGGNTAYYFTSYGTWPDPAGAPGNADADPFPVFMTVVPSGATDNFAGISLLTLNDTGQITFQNSTNSTNAFRVLNAAATTLFNVDTTSDRVQITPSAIFEAQGTVQFSDLGTVGGTGNALCLDGSAVVRSSGTNDCTVSSARYKENIETMREEMGLDVINALRPVTFTYIDGDGSAKVGLLAEEVNEVLPEVVAYDEQGLPNSLDYGMLTANLIKAIQQQQVQIDELREGVLSGALVEISGHIRVGDDTAGTVTIPAGQTSATVTFDSPYEFVPKITTGTSDFAQVIVNDKTVNGFTVRIQNPHTADIHIDWTALETE